MADNEITSKPHNGRPKIEVFKNGRKLKPSTYKLTEFNEQYKQNCQRIAIETLPVIVDILHNSKNDASRVNAYKVILQGAGVDNQHNVNVSGSVTHFSYADILKDINKRIATEIEDADIEEVEPTDGDAD